MFNNSGEYVKDKRKFVKYLDPSLPAKFLSDNQPEYLVEISVYVIGFAGGKQQLHISLKRKTIAEPITDTFLIKLPFVQNPEWRLTHNSLGWGFQSSNIGSVRPHTEDDWHKAKENTYHFAS